MTDALPIRVLVIEDDPDTRMNLCDILELDGHEVETAASVAETLARANWQSYAAVLLDRLLPDGNAEKLLPQLKRLAPQAAIMIVTGYSDLAGAIAALREGAADYIIKPINADALRASLARIAERRRLAQAQERSEAAFRTLIEAAPCLIVILRPDRRIVYSSPFSEQLTGHQADSQDFLSTFIADETLREEFGRKLDQVGAGQPARGLECPVSCKDQSRRWIVWNAERLQDYEGQPAILAVGLDITEQKQAQETALRAERLAAIGQMVTGLAHESRNALQLIQANLEMLALEVEDRPEALQLITAIQGAEDRIHRLFEDVRGYAAPINLEREDFDLSRLWRAVWQQVAVRHNGKEVEITEDVDHVNLRCRVDLFSTERVFRNIFENALDACAGPARVHVRCTDSRIDGRPALQVSIQDNGPGLNAEQRQSVFQPFFTTKRQGTGLGLAIVKRIVEAHGGQIRIGNGTQPGAGAEIILTLPRETP
jgi:PAS domain S-box-containing protein